MMCTDSSPEWIFYACKGVLLLAFVLLVVVMQKAEHDKVSCDNDSRSVRSARRWSFVAVEASALFAFWTNISPISFLLLISTTIALLTINAVSLSRRPPNRDSGVHASEHPTVVVPGWAHAGADRRDRKLRT